MSASLTGARTICMRSSCASISRLMWWKESGGRCRPTGTEPGGGRAFSMITCGFSAWKVLSHSTSTPASLRHCATRMSPGQFHRYSASHLAKSGSAACIAPRETAMPAPPLANSGCRTPLTMPSRCGDAMNAYPR